MSVKKALSTIATIAVIGGIGAGGWYLYKHNVKPGAASSSKVYVQKVSNLNTINSADLFANNYMGVIEAQKSVDVKYDKEKTVDKVLVAEGDRVKKGDKLLTYSIEDIQIKIDEATIEVERMQNSITSNENQIAQLEKEKKKAGKDDQAYFTTQILELQSDNAMSEYEIKAKNVEITKLKASLENAYITAPITGTVKDLKDPEASDEMNFYGYGYGDSADVIMKITADGDYRVKGTINEQNMGDIVVDTPVFIKSRKDDTQWHGVIEEISAEPQENNQNFYMYDEDTDNMSSKYAFYVKPDSLDGFILGQHVLIELDNGQAETKEKTGLWLYSNFVLKDGDKYYVWAKDDKDRVEKRYVKIGEIDDDYGDMQIVSGLESDDYIAYPAEYIEEGMMTTTNKSDKDIPKNDLGGEDMGDMGGMDGDMGYVDDGMEIEGDMPEVEYDEDGNMMFTDEMGNSFTVLEDGSMSAVSPDGGVLEMDAMGNFTKGGIDDMGNYIFDYSDAAGGTDIGEDGGEPVGGEGEIPETPEEPEAPDLTFEDIYGITQDEFDAMTPQEQDAFLKKHYES